VAKEKDKLQMEEDRRKRMMMSYKWDDGWLKKIWLKKGRWVVKEKDELRMRKIGG
jgi:hypothetical protein